MSGELLIRRYRDEDRAAVIELHHAALGAVAGAHAGEGPWDDDLEHVVGVYIGAGGDFLVGVLEGEIVAMGALLRTDAERAEIRRMRVKPSCWRRGYGQAMLIALESSARDLGYRCLHLDTVALLVAAEALYRRNGYREVGRVERSGHSCVLFEKELNPEP